MKSNAGLLEEMRPENGNLRDCIKDEETGLCRSEGKGERE